MFDQLFTATQINDEIADRDGLDAEAKKGLVLKTKFLNQRGLLTNEHDPDATNTTAKLYKPIELARIAVLTDMLVAGFSGEGLMCIANAMRKAPNISFGHPPSADIDGAYVYEGGGLASAIHGIIADDPGKWRLDFSCGRESGKEPVWVANVLYLPEGEPEPISYLNILRRPIMRGSIDLTDRLSKFSDLLKG